MSEPPTLLQGDCFEVLQTLDAESVDSCVCDPPYSLGFMGKKWDRHDSPLAFQEWCEKWAREVFRVLKPGAHLIAFGGTRTYHRLACGIEDAGFEIRDQIGWLYGCLSDDTEILINGQWEHHHKATAESLAMCYDMERDEYSWQPIQERVVYDYADTAYRIQSDRTDQIVSRNHRCIVERFGDFTFELAEEIAWEREARVPILEDLPDLLRAVPLPRQGAGAPKQDVQQALREQSDRRASQAAAVVATQRDEAGSVLGVRQESLQADGVAEAGEATGVLLPVQRREPRRGVGEARAQGASGVDGCEHGVLLVEDDGRQESGMEGRRHVLQKEGQLQADQIRSVPPGVSGDGAQGRLRDGTPAIGGASNGAAADQKGNGASREPRPAGQSTEQSAAVCEQPRSQAVRASRFTQTDLATVTPFVYEGIVWCVRVPTGAFVARRNGKVFVTGNSGFPKSLDIGKAIDKAAGAEREVVGKHPNPAGSKGNTFPLDQECDITAPATDAAKQWDGWGTALKPAWEPIVVARKPLDGTVAQNILEHGVGGINVDGCRIPTGDDLNGGTRSQGAQELGRVSQVPGNGIGEFVQPPGRFPANVIHDGSDEVLAEFAKYGESKSGVAVQRHGGGQSIWKAPNTMGARDDVGFGDTGTAARFFKACKETDEEWLDRNLHLSVASTAGSSLSLRNQSVASALSYAVTSVLPGGSLCTNLSRGPTTNVTPTELRRIAEGVIETIPDIVQKCLLGPLPGEPTKTRLGASVAALRTQTGIMRITVDHWRSDGSVDPVTFSITETNLAHGDRGSRSRIHYTAKASKDDRNDGLHDYESRVINEATPPGTPGSNSPRAGAGRLGPQKNHHPTVKPTSLMRYLVRLVTPKGGLVLDPFAGSGTTLIAAYREDCRAIGIELDPDYFKMAQHRIDRATAQLRLDL